MLLKTYLVMYQEPEGNLRQYFKCQADDTEHAIEQCKNAYPDCEIIQVAED